MPDTTKERFLEMLECVDNPVITTRKLPRPGRVTVYWDVLLVYSGYHHTVLKRMRQKGFAPRMALPDHEIILACVRFKVNLDNKRFLKKKAKYERWLQEGV